jgi:hypothetical protein
MKPEWLKYKHPKRLMHDDVAASGREVVCFVGRLELIGFL